MQTTNAWAKTLIKKYRAKLGPMRDNLGPRTNKNKISTTSFKLSKTTLK
jgi:hypothetical protein